MADFVTQLEALLAKATPEPVIEMVEPGVSGSLLGHRNSRGEWIYTCSDDDMDLLILLRNHAPALLDVVKAAKLTVRLEALDHNDDLVQALRRLDEEE
jgi:hypothetical protein